MQITKTEEPTLVVRQLAFLKATASPLNPVRKGESSYVYDYVPGESCRDVALAYHYLRDNVWNRRPLLAHDQGDYVKYLHDLTAVLRLPLPTRMVVALRSVCHLPACLVHGDATLENVLSTANGLLLIDPGLPRGFCHPVNDVGKLLQSWLTHWSAVRHGTPPEPYPTVQPLPVNTNTVASLASHWVRIVKNAPRHPPSVEAHARKVVLPALHEALEWQCGVGLGDPWGSDVVRALYDRLRPRG